MPGWIHVFAFSMHTLQVSWTSFLLEMVIQNQILKEVV